jgi:hypothetical protein
VHHAGARGDAVAEHIPPQQQEHPGDEPPTSPDPDPADTAGLEPGGGAAPGDTPPTESSTSGTSHHDPEPASRAVNRAALVVIVLVALVGAAFLLSLGLGVG